jgi:hypothetical protein
MTIPHLDLQIEYLTAIKAGKRMEWEKYLPQDAELLNDCWHNSDAIHPDWHPLFRYRIREAPRQQYIPEADVPRAMEAQPEIGTKYWTLHPFATNAVTVYRWDDGLSDTHAFENGLCFATESDARAAWDAMTARRERS